MFTEKTQTSGSIDSLVYIMHSTEQKSAASGFVNSVKSIKTNVVHKHKYMVCSYH